MESEDPGKMSFRVASGVLLHRTIRLPAPAPLDPKIRTLRLSNR